MSTPEIVKNSSLLDAKKTDLLQLFQSTGHLPSHRSSNTVSFYDLMPKYARNGNEALIVMDSKLATRTYDFSIDGQAFVSEVEAAKLKNPQTKQIEYHFPGTKEELIEDVLRHLLTANRQMTFFDDHVGLQFTIYNISEELKRYKKLKHNGQIKLSLRILRRARLSVYRAIDYKNGTGEPLFEGPFFSDATVIDLNDYFNRGKIEDERKIKGQVKFHNMISLGIAAMDFRLLRYDVIMSYRSEMARWLHKRISHRHRMKNVLVPYKIKLSTVYNDGNWKWLTRLDKCRSKMLSALDDMAKKGQLNDLAAPEFDPIEKDGKVVDFLVKIYLSQEFIDHISHVEDIHSEFIRKIAPPESQTLAQDSPHQPGYAMLLNHNVKKDAAKALAQKFTKSDIENAIGYALGEQQRKYKQNPERYFNIGGYIKRTLENGWAGSSCTSESNASERGPSISNPPENWSIELSDDRKSFVIENWDSWSESMQSNLKKNGFHHLFEEEFQQWLNKSK